MLTYPYLVHAVAKLVKECFHVIVRQEGRVVRGTLREVAHQGCYRHHTTCAIAVVSLRGSRCCKQFQTAGVANG
jgi:hypothetical protein